MRDLITAFLETIPQYDPASEFFGATDMRTAEVLNALSDFCKSAREGLDKPAPVLAVVLDGGIVQSVCTDQPGYFAGVRTVVVDYDVDQPDEEDERLGVVPQEDGSLADAYMQEIEIGKAEIELPEVIGFIDDTSYGASQAHHAVCDNNPCEDCKDCCLDDDQVRCVNEEKCLAWRRYQEG